MNLIFVLNRFLWKWNIFCRLWNVITQLSTKTVILNFFGSTFQSITTQCNLKRNFDLKKSQMQNQIGRSILVNLKFDMQPIYLLGWNSYRNAKIDNPPSSTAFAFHLSDRRNDVHMEIIKLTQKQNMCVYARETQRAKYSVSFFYIHIFIYPYNVLAQLTYSS